ncbi:hypothetical protein [Nocardia sp. X0981]
MTGQLPALPALIALISLVVAGVEVARSTRDVLVPTVVLLAVIVLGGALVRHFRTARSARSPEK